MSIEMFPTHVGVKRPRDQVVYRGNGRPAAPSFRPLYVQGCVQVFQEQHGESLGLLPDVLFRADVFQEHFLDEPLVSPEHPVYPLAELGTLKRCP